jgi:CRISPR/Cas system CSM-associated protein Csm3 (group 7 of RAMP superfamily)
VDAAGVEAPLGGWAEAQTIVATGGDDVMVVNATHPQLRAAMALIVAKPPVGDDQETADTFESGPGRLAPRRSCDVIARRYCVEPTLWRERNREAEILRRSCHVCLLFGGPPVTGRLSVADLMVDSDRDPHMIQVRDGASINRDTLTAKSRRKFDFEVVPPGVRFHLALILDNPEDYEIGLLLRTLALIDEGFAFLGGQLSRGTERARISVEDIVRVDARRLLLGEPLHTEAIHQERYYDALRTKLEGQQAGSGAPHRAA